MATQYSVAIALTKTGFKAIYCGPSEDEAIAEAIKSDAAEVHILSRPPVNRVINPAQMQAKAAAVIAEAAPAPKAKTPAPKKAAKPINPADPDEDGDPLAD